jgi:hypothetical protein
VLPETLLAVTVLPIAGKSFSPENVCQSIILRPIQSQSTTNRCNTCSPVQETVQVTSTIARTSSGNCNSRSAFASAPACRYFIYRPPRATRSRPIRFSRPGLAPRGSPLVRTHAPRLLDPCREIIASAPLRLKTPMRLVLSPRAHGECSGIIGNGQQGVRWCIAGCLCLLWPVLSPEASSMGGHRPEKLVALSPRTLGQQQQPAALLPPPTIAVKVICSLPAILFFALP